MGNRVLSAKRRAILEYIEEFTAANGYAPSVREIGEAVGLRSPSTVHSHLKILEGGGMLQQSAGKTRTLSLPNKPVFKSVPVLGTVTAGMPILATEEIEGYIPYDGGHDGAKLFALRVRGDSMINAAILDGDYVICRQQQTARSGQIVVALIGEEATVKRLALGEDNVWLMPENPAYEPIDGSECSILGLVISLYRGDVR